MQEQKQPTISVVNKYGFISGGCIADMLDRAAFCWVTLRWFVLNNFGHLCAA